MRLKIPEISLVAIDPGAFIGVVEIKRGQLKQAYTTTYEQVVKAVAFNKKPVQIWQKYKLWIVEDFRTYPWMTTAGFNPVIPARLLGVLETAATRSNINITYQMAGLAKQFVDNDKLHWLGWWSKLHNNHERDAARHAAYFLLHNMETKA